MSIAVRPTGPEHAGAILALYRAAAQGPGLARYPDELDAGFVSNIHARAAGCGMSLGAFEGERLLGEIHAWSPGPRKFAHVLGDLTIAVDPDSHGRGVGTRLFEALIAQARLMDPPIERIELFVHEGNPDARRLYERLGFRVEGRMPGRVRLDDGRTFDDLAMALLLTEEP